MASGLVAYSWWDVPTAECSLPFDELRHEEKAIFQQTRGRKKPRTPVCDLHFLEISLFFWRHIMANLGTSSMHSEDQWGNLVFVYCHVGFPEGCLRQPLFSWKPGNPGIPECFLQFHVDPAIAREIMAICCLQKMPLGTFVYATWPTPKWFRMILTMAPAV